ncbi:MAG: hypothetical protein ACRD1E_03305, partial [Terriglobales bacterium]
ANADQARGRLAPAALEAFLRADPSADACYSTHPPNGCPATLPERSDDYWETKESILAIALDDLHAGNLAQAKGDLAALWPAADRDRVQALLLKDYCQQSPRIWFHLSAPPECAGVH